ncbi:zinc finger MYM-type protein 1-like protein [Tanacetum coccineum]
MTDGFISWSKKYGLRNHVGEVNSYHNKALQKCEILLNQKQSIHVAFKKQSKGEAKDYGIRLNLSIETCIFLLKASLPYRGHDKRKDMIRDNYKVRVEAEITTGVIETGQGLNHEITLISIGGAKAWLPVAPTTYG